MNQRIKALKYFKNYENASSYLDEACSIGDLTDILIELNIYMNKNSSKEEIIKLIWKTIKD